MITPGTEMKIKPTADIPAIFHGMRVKVLRQSQHTSGLTVEVLEKRGCYRVGDQLHVAPYDVEPATPPLTAMQTFYGKPTPANAIRLAIADHAAHCAPMTPQSEYTRELNRALDCVEAQAGLITALREIMAHGSQHVIYMDGKGTHAKECLPCIAARALGEK